MAPAVTAASSLCSDAADARESLHFVGAEAQIRLDKLGELMPRSQTGGVQRRRHPTGHDEMTVGRQRCQHLGEEFRATAVGEHQVRVVDHDGDLLRCSQRDGPRHRYHECIRRRRYGAGQSEAGHDAFTQLRCVHIERCARHVQVEAEGLGEVVMPRLAEQRRLAESGPGNDRGETRLEPVPQGSYQIGPIDRVQQRCMGRTAVSERWRTAAPRQVELGFLEQNRVFEL